MKHYPLLNGKTEKIIFGLFLCVLLFLSRDTLFSSCLVGFAKSQILMLGCILLLGIYFLCVNRKELFPILKDGRMLVLGASVLIVVLPMVLKRDWQLMYFSILLCIFTAVFLTYFTTTKEVAKYYVLILSALGLYSLLATYGLKYLARAELIAPEIFRNSNRWMFYNFGFAYAVPSLHWFRNFGIFREPGVYQFFVLLAIYLNNYAVDWNLERTRWVFNVVLVITMLSTFAIGGYAELALLAVFLFFEKKWHRTVNGQIAAVLIAAAAVCVLVCVIFFYNHPYMATGIFYEINDMITRLTTESDSRMDRQNAILINLQFIQHHPLIGNAISDVLHGTEHNTSSTLLLYAIFGIAGGTLNVAGWIALLWKRERMFLGNLFLLVIMFMSFNTQNLTANVFFWLFPMMALVELGLPLLKKE